MKKTVIGYSDLKDSKILYEKDLPPFGFILLSVLLLLMVYVAIWGFSHTKPYVVKGVGTVESPGRNYVMAPFAGEVERVAIKEGDYVSEGDVLFVMEGHEAEIQIEQIEKQNRIYEQQISQYEKLAQSIRDDKNHFSPSTVKDSAYYSQFEEYKRQVEQQAVDVKGLKETGYTKDQIQVELNKADERKAEIYYSALNSAESAKKQAEMELELLRTQKDALEKDEMEHTIRAPTSGTIHMMGELKKGIVVQAAESVASISAENDRFHVSAQISSADRSRIREGCRAELEIAGLQQNVYGTISGRVTEIDSDMSFTGKGGGYFNIKVAPEKYYLVNREGNKVNLTSGLQSEVRIIYDEITYAAYVLDALGVKD